MARPSNLTPEIQKRILTAISTGNTRTTAAAYAGIGLSTLMLWLSKGRCQKSGQYVELLEAIEKAEADAITTSVALIRQAGRESWQAAAWWLERRYPDEWGRKERIQIEGLIQREAERLAQERGLSADAIVAEANSILARSS